MRQNGSREGSSKGRDTNDSRGKHVSSHTQDEVHRRETHLTKLVVGDDLG